ncbi:MAG TPA: adenosylhomocysteinase [Candidatus Binataceae bacterium]|nr:adenosylhomocysteinase [Candidatus Binataceae bacterium]
MSAPQTTDAAPCERGRSLIEWSERRMPALALLKREFAERRPLDAIRIGGSLHLTPETGALARCLRAGGASLALCGSNPLSTRDEICAALSFYDSIPTFAHYGEDRESYYAHMEAVAATRPDIVLDDGADLITFIAQKPRHSLQFIGVEQTTTGVMRLRAMERDEALPCPVVALNDAPLKQEFDNLYGTGQNTIDGILRAANILIAGKTVVIAGYGWVGRGIANRMRGHGANVIVTEVNPTRALHAYYDGFRVMTIGEAITRGDIFVTATGCRDVVGAEHFTSLRDGAILANSGHFDVEVNVAALETIAAAKTVVRPNLAEYSLPNGRRVFLLAEGRLVGQSAAEASPADVMDLTFTLMAMTVEWIAENRGALRERKVKLPPPEFTERVAEMKLRAVGIAHDALTESQRDYIASWSHGT